MMDVDMAPVLLENNNVSMPKMDADLIEALWKQDIDMGVTREDRFPNKMEVELEKPEPIEKQIQQYDIDCETGEYLPRVPPSEPTPSVPSTDVTSAPDEGAVFDDFITDLLDGYNPESGESSSNSRVIPQLTDALEIEQRWQDLASISEFQMSPLGSSNRNSNPVINSSQSSFPNTTWNSSVSSTGDQDVFAFNATTNGNVNLQNATGPQLSLFNSTDQPLNSNLLEDPDNQFLTSMNDTPINLPSHDDLFSPISRFNDMTISRGLSPVSPASSQGSSVNLTMLMMDQQALELPPVTSPQQLPPASASPMARPNGSLLLELLNTTEANASNASEDMDSDMQELDTMIEMLTADHAPMDLLSDDESFHGGDVDALEGATGSNKDTFEGDFKQYSRGGDSPCFSDTGSSSSYDSSGSTENVHHNHSYAASSESGSPKCNFRSSNGSKNGTDDGAAANGVGRVSRDERRAKELNIPISVDKIINLPVDSFNELLKKHDLSSEQLQLIRDIRRRGKNKVAAQNCRKRKISAIHQVEGSVGAMKNEHDKLLKERDKVAAEMAIMQERFDNLYRQVFRNMRDRNGDLVDPREYRLEVMGDGSVILVPRNDTGLQGSSGHVTDEDSSSN